MSIRVLHGDCLIELPRLAAAGERFHAAVLDPPYGLEFMGKEWDGANGFRRSLNAEDAGRASVFGRTSQRAPEYRATPIFQEWCEAWARAVYDVLLPGAHLVAFGGTRTSHRMVCAIEDAGFEIRDTIAWIYGSGFPKSLNVSKAIDRAAGVEREVIGPGNRHNSKRCAVAHGDTERLAGGIPDITGPATPEAAQWEGWGTALKPSYEPIVVARKPLSEHTVAANVLRHGTGGINVDACRLVTAPGDYSTGGVNNHVGTGWGRGMGPARTEQHALGRWPANLVHDGSPEVEAAFAAFGQAPGQQRYVGPEHGDRDSVNCYGDYGARPPTPPRGDAGTASRFFYSAKATASDRADSRHPTVKPIDLMRWLVTLVCPPGGHVLDCFAGSGTTGEACMLAGFDCTLIEREAQHVRDIEHRIKRWSGKDAPLFAQVGG